MTKESARQIANDPNIFDVISKKQQEIKIANEVHYSAVKKKFSQQCCAAITPRFCWNEAKPIDCVFDIKGC